MPAKTIWYVSPGATVAKVLFDNAHRPQRLSLSGMSRYHLGACPTTIYVCAPLILMGMPRYHLHHVPSPPYTSRAPEHHTSTHPRLFACSALAELQSSIPLLPAPTPAPAPPEFQISNPLRLHGPTPALVGRCKES